jgi:hypothetical protein
VALQKELILTLFITILIESGVVIGYCHWRKKPVQPILFTSICGNLITQSLLWIVLSLFFQSYLLILLITELLIWILEGLLLSVIPTNRLRWIDAIFLSLSMNLLSFGVGWFLPV